MFLNTLLQNQIDISQVPFSDRGSRLLIFREADESRLYIKLAERLMELDPALEAYVHRPPFIQDLNLLGPNGDVLDFSIDTSPALLELKSQIGKFELAFRDETTLAFGLPDNSTSGIRFKVQSDRYQVTAPDGESYPIRHVVHGTNGSIVKEQITPVNDGHIVEVLVRGDEDCTLQLHIDDKIFACNEIPPFSAIRTTARKRWQAWFEQVPPVAKQYQRTYAYAWWVMANNLISPSGNVKFESMMPTKAKYIGLWLWDSALHALAFRHIDPELARNQIRIFLAYQLPDGMLPDVVFDEGIVGEIDHPVQARVTKPPILAWAALKIHEIAPDSGFLQEIYDPLTRWNAWWFDQSNDGQRGLAQYNHPYSSGADDSPLWDAGMPVVAPDLNTYLYIQIKALAQIARELGLETEVAKWEKRSGKLLQKMILELWDEKNGLFRVCHNGNPVAVTSPFNLYPLWTGDLPKEIQNRLLEHLQNPGEFWGEVMLPTVARNDPKYAPETMWRGPVWANINYFFIEALTLTGLQDIAKELRDITLHLLMKTNGIHEYYHAETGQPPSTAAPMFGWTAAVFIDLAIQASVIK